MSEKLNCTNCCIGNFKYELCDCNGEFCKEFKRVGDGGDFIKSITNRVRKKSEWRQAVYGHNVMRFCPECGYNKLTHGIANETIMMFKYCPECGTDMRGE